MTITEGDTGGAGGKCRGLGGPCCCPRNGALLACAMAMHLWGFALGVCYTTELLKTYFAHEEHDGKVIRAEQSEH